MAESGSKDESHTNHIDSCILTYFVRVKA